MVVTLGARGFSCAVSGVGHVSIVTRAKNEVFLAACWLVQCQRPSAAISARKTSGTQGTRLLHTLFGAN